MVNSGRFLMKRIIFLMSLLALLIPIQANAEYFNCALALNLIEDTDSSEIKQLAFDIDLSPGVENIMTGAMISTSCFNTITETFISNSSKIETNENQTNGTLKNPNIAIGKYHYQLNLTFSQINNGPNDANVINFIVSGKMRSLDNEQFIHQNAEGECHLAKKEHFSKKFLSMGSEMCKNIFE
jgi:hypothetical protein